MKARKMIRIIDNLIDNEVVKFEDDYGQRIDIYRASSTFYEMSSMDRQGKILSSTYFNRYEDDGGDVRLYWDVHIVGMIYPERLNVPSESIYS